MLLQVCPWPGSIRIARRRTEVRCQAVKHSVLGSACDTRRLTFLTRPTCRSRASSIRDVIAFPKSYTGRLAYQAEECGALPTGARLRRCRGFEWLTHPGSTCSLGRVWSKSSVKNGKRASSQSLLFTNNENDTIQAVITCTQYALYKHCEIVPGHCCCTGRSTTAVVKNS